MNSTTRVNILCQNNGILNLIDRMMHTFGEIHHVGNLLVLLINVGYHLEEILKHH
jgi:hypothetical protein